MRVVRWLFGNELTLSQLHHSDFGRAELEHVKIIPPQYVLLELTLQKNQ